MGTSNSIHLPQQAHCPCRHQDRPSSGPLHRKRFGCSNGPAMQPSRSKNKPTELGGLVAWNWLYSNLSPSSSKTCTIPWLTCSVVQGLHLQARIGATGYFDCSAKTGEGVLELAREITAQGIQYQNLTGDQSPLKGLWRKGTTWFKRRSNIS